MLGFALTDRLLLQIPVKGCIDAAQLTLLIVKGFVSHIERGVATASDCTPF